MPSKKKLIIPTYAKKSAKRALILRKKLSKSKKSSLSPSAAKRLGIISGVNQARFIIKNKSMNKRKAKQFYRFYQRFKNCRTKKCEQALNLWGGRKFLKTKVFRFIKRNVKQRRMSKVRK